MKKTIQALLAAALFAIVATGPSAKAQSSPQSDNQASTTIFNKKFGKENRILPRRPKATSETCAGIRGNGQNLFAHFGVLARHTEEYGAIACAAGGSSGSITAFVLESIWANPDVHKCDWGLPCSEIERDLRISLLLKSFIGLSEAGLFEDIATINELLQGIEENQIMEKMAGPSPAEGVAALIRLLRDLGPLINPEVIELLLTSPDPVFHATDIVEGLQKGVQFIVDDPRVFLRTSVINFDQAAEIFGLYGSFYSSYGPADRHAIRNWLRTCASPSRGLTWAETSALPGIDGRTCGENLNTLFNAYRERFAFFNGQSRIDDPVGRYFPAFGVTGVIKGQSIEIWREAREAWLAATPIPFEPNFDDIGVGYWGNTRELDRMERVLNRSRSDLGSRQFTKLGETTWREVLSSSPAEPGFSPAVQLNNGLLSVGGWADPLRVLPLDALGARATIAVNRRDGVGSFTVDLTRLLNASEAEVDALYSFTDSRSTFFQSLEEATGVWCTDWDGQMSIPNLLFNDAFTSPLITSFRKFLRPRFGYENVGPDFPIVGCKAGVAE